jgi:L-ribulose-5-phosphate 4-epimerase
VEVAVVLEEVAKMAWLSMVLEPKLGTLAPHIAERHYTRKHGPDAYYGQTGQS